MTFCFILAVFTIQKSGYFPRSFGNYIHSVCGDRVLVSRRFRAEHASFVAVWRISYTNVFKKSPLVYRLKAWFLKKLVSKESYRFQFYSKIWNFIQLGNSAQRTRAYRSKLSCAREVPRDCYPILEDPGAGREILSINMLPRKRPLVILPSWPWLHFIQKSRQLHALFCCWSSYHPDPFNSSFNNNNDIFNQPI